jgi:hypothetical protein
VHPFRTAAAGVALLLALTGCSSSSDGAAEPSQSPTASASGQGCDADTVTEALCRVVTAAQSGDVAALSEGEQEVAGAVGDELAGTAYAVEECVLVGDVTVACEVSFEGEEQVLGFHVVPVDAEFVDGAIVTEDGGDVRYEVDGYLGRGERGSFASLP